ncbi:MAG: bacillithiol system redox-active protein YtxJ [Chitinophagales bacterium]|nr:bacillithiol system redox-active protein YtxJ [Chitinophagales bacterium]
MRWKELTSATELNSLMEESFQHPVAIFKHSTRCSISSMAKARLEREWNIPEEKLPVYYLDLLKYRVVSDAISTTTGVEHESPQLLIIKDGKSVFDASHNAVTAKGVDAFVTT